MYVKLSLLTSAILALPAIADGTAGQTDPWRKYMPQAYLQKHQEAVNSGTVIDTNLAPRAYALSAVAEETDGTVDVATNTEDDPKRRHVVGRGFYTYDNIPAFQSALDLDSYQVYINKPSSELNYTLSFDTSKLTSELGYGANASVPIEGVNLVAENKFLNEFETNSKTSSLIYSFTYKYRYSITQSEQGPVMMSEPALALYQEDPESFVSTYGNRFVSAADVGGAIFLMVKVHFTSVKDKAAFEEKVGAELPGVASIGAYIKGSLAYDDANGKVQLYALQVGGKPLELGKIIGTDGSKNYNFADVSALDEKLRAANDYIQSFAEQIDPDDAQTSVVLGTPSTMSYTSLGNIPQGSHLPDQPFDETVEAARQKIQDGYSHFRTIKNKGIAIARQIDERAGQLIYVSDKNKLERLLKYYDTLQAYYKQADNTPQQYCYLPGEEEKYCTTAADNLDQLVYQAGFESQQELEQIAADFGFTVNLDDTLYAYPVSTHQPLVDMLSKIPRGDKLTDDRGYAQVFAMFNADNKYVGNATLTVNQYDMDLIGPSLPESWSFHTLATERFDQFAFSGGYVNLQWLNEYDRDDAGPLTLHADLSGKGLFSTVNGFDGALFKGVNYGNSTFKFGGKRHPAVMINDLFRSAQIFRFDHADPLNNGIPESRYCFANGNNTAWLINERTGQSDGGPVWSTQCVTARPGDVISWTVYWFLSDYAITKQWTIASPDNRHTNEVLYSTVGAGAVPAGQSLPGNIGENVIVIGGDALSAR